MGELKSCLFCGKNVDTTYQYCPHCGYEFAEEKFAGYRGAEEKSAGLRGAEEKAHGAEAHGAQDEDLPSLAEEATCESLSAGEQDYLLRLRTLQELLSDMERELDLIIKTSSGDP